MVIAIVPILFVALAALFFVFQGDEYFYRRFTKKSGVELDSLTESALDGTNWLSVSFVATQLTVAAGIIAIISGFGFYGPWILAAPITFLVGITIFYFIYGIATRKLEQDRVFITRSEFYSTPYFQVFCLAALTINIFLIGWEFFIVAEIFASFYKSIDTFLFLVNNSFLIAAALACVTFFYLSRGRKRKFSGSWNRAVMTDVVQFGAIVAFLAILVPLALEGGAAPWAVWELPVKANQAQIVLFIIPLSVRPERS